MQSVITVSLKLDTKPKIFHSPTIRAGNNAKTIKGDKASEYATAIMYLAPAKMAGGANLCAMAHVAKCDPNDGGGCLYEAGRAAVHKSVNIARVNKTKRYLKSRSDFMTELVRDIKRFIKWCAKLGKKPAIRLNGTSDIQWEIAHPCIVDGVRYASLFAAFPEVQFYDYTKIVKRVLKPLPSNYHLTLSYSNANPDYAKSVVNAARESGANIAVVYRTKELRDDLTQYPIHFEGITRAVINGDLTDMRFVDPSRVIVGLYAKGKAAKRDTSGFVIGVAA
jgi:hypothetical protein